MLDIFLVSDVCLVNTIMLVSISCMFLFLPLFAHNAPSPWDAGNMLNFGHTFELV